jgi:uncharacterized iron-regulated membrane protein
MVWLHRWFGLFLAGFLLIEGLTGSLLAFNAQLTRWLNPHLFATHSRGEKMLGLGELAERAMARNPDLEADYFARVTDQQALLRVEGRMDPATGREVVIGFKYLALDPCTGEELGRLGDDFRAKGFPANIMPLVYRLHIALALGDRGTWLLSAVALVWTVDCFIGFYLTLPASSGQFWRNWSRAWQIRRTTNPFSLNFDLHRAAGLWLWLLLFIFAWSSVGLVEHSMPVYEWVMAKALPYQKSESEINAMPSHSMQPAKLGWIAAQAVGEKLMAEQASLQGFKVGEPTGMAYLHGIGLYDYTAATDRRFPHRRVVDIMFDGDTGALYAVDKIPGDGPGNEVNNWLRSLHMVSDPVDILPYRIVVFVVGIGIAILSVTGVYIWWRKRRARTFVRQPSDAATVGEASLL